MRKKVNPSIPQFCYIKVGNEGVLILRSCFPDDDGLLNKPQGYSVVFETSTNTDERNFSTLKHKI